MPEQNPNLPRTRDFAAFFAADLPVKRIDFTIQGQPCWVDLRAMDSEAADTFKTFGIDYRMTPGQAVPEITKADLSARNTFLLAHTIVGWQLWTQPELTDGKKGEWQQVSPPDGFAQMSEAQRERVITQQFKCSPEARDWLAEQCQAVNGLTEPDAKN